MICKNCGTEFPDYLEVCPNCGAAKEQSVQDTGNFDAEWPWGNQGNPKAQESAPIRCPVCGQTSDGSGAFCPECGTPYPDMRAKGTAAAKSSPSDKKKAALSQKGRNILIIYGAAILLCISIAVFFALWKPRINLNKYLSLEVEGFDTAATARAEFDTEKFIKDYGTLIRRKTDKKDKSKKEKASIGSLFSGNFSSGEDAQSMLNSCVSGSFEQDTKLSNGDTVIYYWECDSEKAEELYGVKLRYKDIREKVKGLETAEEFNPFAGISVVFSGTAPWGNAQMEGEPNNKEAANLSFQFDNNHNLSNGDEVVLSVTSYGEDPIDYCIREYGKIPNAVEKRFKVEGLSEYVHSMKSVSEESLAKMKEFGEEVYRENFGYRSGEEEELVAFEYIENALLTNKNPDYFDDNMACFVYRADIKQQIERDGKTYENSVSVYWYISYFGVIAEADGTVNVDSLNYNTPYVSVDTGITDDDGYTYSWSYAGYESMEDLAKDLIGPRMEEYDVEENLN